MEKNRSRNRALLMLIGGFICIAMSSGVLISSISMYLAPVAKKLGTNAGVVGYFFTFNAICAFIASFVALPIIKRFRLPGLITFGGIAGFLCMIGVAWAPSAAVICAAGFFSGACTHWCSNPVLQPAVARWFMFNRGKYGAIMGLGEWVGATVFSYIAAIFIESGNYETACIITAVCILLLTIVSAYVLIKGYPEELKLKPVGYDKYQQELEAAKDAKVSSTDDGVPGMTRQEILKKPAFWTFLIANFFMVFACTTYSGQQSTIYLAAGVTTMQVASLVSIYAAAKVLNKLLYGVVADRFGVFIGSAYTIVLTLAGLVIFLTAKTFGMLAVGAVLVGSGQGLAGISGTLGLSKIIGQKNIGELGIMPHGAAALGGVLGPTFFNIIYSTTGNISTAIYLGLGTWIVTAVFVAISLRKKNFVELDGKK